MEPNPILAEIRATREKLARDAEYDVDKFMAFIRRRESESASRGVIFVTPLPPAPNGGSNASRER